MTQSLNLPDHDMVALTRTTLLTLRSSLMRDAGPAAATYLQEAGYAGGESLFSSFRAWLSERTSTSAEALDLSQFERYASEFFRAAGWGTMSIGSLREAVATLDSSDWSEADPRSGIDFPACHLTTGMFADFFGRVANEPVAVLEVECRSMGAPRCRFLVGNAEVMEYVYDEMGRGVDYEGALANV